MSALQHLDCRSCAKKQKIYYNLTLDYSYLSSGYMLWLHALAMCSGYMLYSYVLSGYMLSGYVLSGYMLSGYVLSGYMPSGYVLVGYMLFSYVLWLHALAMCSGFVLWLKALSTRSASFLIFLSYQYL